MAAGLAAAAAMSYASATAFADKLRTVDGVTYLYSDSGTQKGKYTGWAKAKSGTKYYYKDGVKLTNKWLKVKGKKTYYLKSNGKLATGNVFFSNGKTYYFGNNGKLIYGISATAEDICDTGMTVCVKGIVINDNDADALTGLEYHLEVKSADGSWENVPMITDDYRWDDIGILLFDYGDLYEKKTNINWKDLYGSLPAGDYRLCKSYSVRLDPNERYESKDLYIPFSIEKRDDDMSVSKVFSAAELKVVRDYIQEHFKEFGLCGAYTDVNNNCVVAEISDKTEINSALQAYIDSLEDKRILRVDKVKAVGSDD